MEEIKLGDYVRTKKGYIGYVVSINDFREPNKKYAIEMQKSDLVFVGEKDIKAHSPNLIDLIEVGDYVNGQLIEKIDSKEQDKIFYEFLENEDGSYEAMGMCELKDIKSIVTKEQFAEMEYKVNE